MKTNTLKKIAFTALLLISLLALGAGALLASRHYDNVPALSLARTPKYANEEALTEYQKCVVTAQYIFADSKPNKFEFMRNICNKLPAEDNDFE